ncbi:BatA domain-containing protein [bacterium]|nr:BatA domain-containing protein [bacterium]
MTFLHTIFLTALIAAAIPVLLHIFSKQRLPLIRFSSIDFLLKLQKKKARRVKLRQLILLLIRTAAIIAIVLAFARPAIRNDAATGSAANVESVIIIDNSLPTSAESKNGQIFRNCIDMTEKVVNISLPGDIITLITSTEPQKLLRITSAEKDLILDRLEQIEPRFVEPHMEDAIAIADSILFASSLMNREIYIISPFYRDSFDSLIISKERNEFIRAFLLPVGPKTTGNISISDIKILSSIFQRGEPVEIEAFFHNHSDHAVQNAMISVYLESERVAQASLNIPSKGEKSYSFSLSPHSSGLLTGSIRCDDLDALPADSRRYFVLDIPDSTNVLSVAPNKLDSLIINSALKSDKTGFINLYQGNPLSWETIPLAGFDVVMLTGVSSLSTGTMERLVEFVEQGGGIIIFQGTDTDLAGLSRGLWGRLGFSGARETISSGGIGWGKIDPSHPLFHGMFEEKGAPRSPVFNFAVDLATGKGDQIIIPLSNGRPFLIERQVGKGRALMFAVSPGPDGGDFAYSGIIAPLIFRAVAYAAQNYTESRYEWTTGNSSRILLSVPFTKIARLEQPDGNFIDLSPRPIINGVEYNVPMVELPGIYKLKIRDHLEAVFAGNIPSGLSSLERSDLEKLTDRLGNTTVVTADQDNLAESIQSIRFGRELWKFIAVLFLILLLAESLIGRTWKKESVE